MQYPLGAGEWLNWDRICVEEMWFFFLAFFIFPNSNYRIEEGEENMIP